MLQRQTPASTIPRFNPHGYQPPPQEKKRETEDAGKKKQKVVEEEEVDFSKFSIEELLLNMNIQFRNPSKAPGGWLPLEAYDDKDMDTKSPTGWLIIHKKDPNRPSAQEVMDGNYIPTKRRELTEIGAKGLWKDRDGLCFWRELKIQRYLYKSERYEGYWESTKEKVKLNRIYVLFDAEDPRKFAQRFKKAYDTRAIADSLLKYNFYIENMVDLNQTSGIYNSRRGKSTVDQMSSGQEGGAHQIPEIDNEQVNRILTQTQNSKALRGKSSSDTTALLSEVNFEYAKTMNKIIFDKHMKQSNGNLIVDPLNLPQEKVKGPAPEKGMIKIPEHNFSNTFNEFYFNTILNKDQSIRAMQEIRKECNDVRAMDVYNPNINKPMKVTEFNQVQKSSISKISYYLKETWVNKIKEIIKTNFYEDPAISQQFGRPWFSLNDVTKDSYELGKLKKFLKQTNFIMQDTLLFMTQDSVKRFVDKICWFIPHETIVTDAYNVENVYYTPEEVAKMGAPKDKIPLFDINLELSADGKTVQYSCPIKEVVRDILHVFDHGIKQLQEIQQIEQKLLPHLFKSNQKNYLKATIKPQFRPVDPDPNDPREMPDPNTWVYDEYDKLYNTILKMLEPMEKYFACYDKYAKENDKLDPEGTMAQYEDPENWPTVDELKGMINYHKKQSVRLKGEIPEEAIVSCFKISTRALRDLMCAKHDRIAREMIELIAKITKQTSNKILKDFELRNIKVEGTPKGIEELSELKDYMNGLPMELEKTKAEIKNCMKNYHTLDEFQYRWEDEDEYDRMWRVYGAPLETVQRIEKQQGFLEKEKEKFIKQMEQGKKEFNNEISDIENLVTGFKQFSDIANYEEIAGNAKAIKVRIDEANDRAKTINNRENLVEFEDLTDYTLLPQLNKDFKPFFDLWTTIEVWKNSFKGWLEDPFDEVDPSNIEEISDNSNKVMAQVIRAFRDKDLPNILSIAEQTKKDVEAFKPHVPVLVGLRTEGMKDRHWEALSTAVGFEVRPYEGFTYNKCIEMKLHDHTDAVVDIGEKAGKEFGIETQLAKMKSEWVPLELGFKPFKNTGTFTVIGFEDANAMLDEHTVMTQTMMFSPFRGPFEQEIDEWNTTLLNVTDTIDMWLKVQNAWMYLQPIFDAPDIQKQLPSENKKFKGIDKLYRATIIGTQEDPNTLAACSREGLLQKFTDAERTLDVVKSGLMAYLESKRAVFARFYFLANEDLLQILSQTKEVTNVRPHLRKVFENLMDVTFKPDKTISSMFSGEKEEIPFDEAVDPKDKGVEFWMGDLENMMFASIRTVLYKSIKDYEVKSRDEWTLLHPGQCILNGSQVHWTQEVEEALKENKLAEYLKKLEDQLLATVALVKRKLTKLQSITLGALITIDVHAKDTIVKLVNMGINDLNDFEWISQLRYYWAGPGSDKNKDCYVRCIQTDFPYGYEYLGNTFRLVITPLTDKCYMTLMGALKLNLGGAPAGPAGTGKTETTKDLAKALAKQCVVFNCSPGMDYLMIGKFFKGLSASGAWACFDEFNRIKVEVLSVVAQQLQQLFDAKAKGAEELFFEESQIKMKPTFCAFITMNPGYAGRAELPDNLVALFRPVAMMVPNYAMIGEISLYSFGYTQARPLSVKMVTTFKLNSEQLSAQQHYDYGMRAVKSVINAAGLQKRLNPDMDEYQLMLKALLDVNVPKFLKEDLPLFNNIITDLFPGVDRPDQVNQALMDQLAESSRALNKQPTDAFLAKIIQLYDTTLVRHGLMLVGPTGGGKTSNYYTLAHAQTALKNLEIFEKTHYHKLNPKSILQGQMYGDFDPATTEWEDGVLAKMIQDCAADESPDKHWVVFDGPVDALWIENMNTVLDDNKKLCLNSGQIISLTPQMTMMFEVEDLAVASPATVSRCGMVYMEPGAIGNDPLVASWLNTCPSTFKKSKKLVPKIQEFFKKYLEDALKFMRKNCKEPVFTVNNNLVQSMMRILDCYFNEYEETEVRKVTAEDIEDLESQVDQILGFAMTWSIGVTTNQDGRTKIDRKFRQMFGDKIGIPSEGTIYDYMWNLKKKEWQQWTQTVDPYEVDTKNSYAEVIVPTFDSIRMKYIKRILLKNKKHVLSPGPTGTGKTVNIQILLSQEMPEEFQQINITFSAQTSAMQLQQGLDEQFEKRRKGIYGPPTGKKFVIFIDDLNMPKKEEFGAQPPIELIRQWQDHQGWYDHSQKEKPFMTIQDIIFCSSMGPPGGGREPLTQRLQRHYNIITYTDLGPESVTMIFEKILNAFIGGFSTEVRNTITPLVAATQQVFKGVTEKLKPTPAKSHYTFNLRDISKIFQGVCSADQKQTTTAVDLVRIWLHENQRVFSDRMINTQDKDILQELCVEQAEKMKIQKPAIFNVERIIFGDYFNGIDGENRPYVQISDIPAMIEKIKEYLEDFNSGTKHPMKLVMFLDACDHVSRICRVLRQPLGNALLLGVGGSGRQSLSKLATFMNNYKLYMIEVVKGYNMTNWRDNLKQCLMQAGAEGKPTSFLFVDTQIINEQMLEDINGVLNSGSVPQLYKAEDMDTIMTVGRQECQRKGLAVNKMNMMSTYLARVKANIHCIIAMSPLGGIFRQRLLKFPSLVNCSTIDWFSEWPEEALISVGRGSIEDGEIELSNEDKEGCIEMFKVIHKSVEKIRVRYLDEARRIAYVTPTSFLELLSSYKTVFKERTKHVQTAKMRLSKGLTALAEAAVEVAKLQKDLEDKAPELEKVLKITAEKKVVIEAENKEAAGIKEKVAAEEEVASVQAAEVQAIKDDADRDLSVALPALDRAVAAVKKIDVNAFYVMKGVNTPGKSIVKMFEVACYMMNDMMKLGGKPKKPQDDKSKEYDPDGYFQLAKQKLLAAPKQFLQNMIEYDKDNIPDPLVQKVDKILKEEDCLADEAISKASKDLVPVKVWVKAMITYHETLKIVNPKRAIAAEKGKELEIVMAKLNEARAKVKAIDDKLATLGAELAAAEKKTKDLNDEMEDCRKKLVRAEKMITGLGGEKDRWTKIVADLSVQATLVTGDCLVAAGNISYCGPFTSQYREELESLWRESIKAQGIKVTENITMSKTLGNDVTIRQWNIAGLPSDKLSVENGIIMFKSRRWPLMIDPQTQANKFIKNMGKDVTTGFESYKSSDPNLLRGLEKCIQFGIWCLIENVGETLDPALEPVLQQQKIKSGSGFVIKLGDKTVTYDLNFKFFLTTTLPNPHYSPETQVKISLLNFAITQFGLEEQMLNQLIKLEFPELAQQKDEIVQQNAKNAKIMYDLEEQILQTLGNAESTMALLSTDELIDILDNSKKVSAEIEEQTKISAAAEKQIDETRELFRVVAFRASILFFCIVDLATINDMYQYSLQWFQNLFGAGVRQSEPADDAQQRIQNLNNYFTLSLYRNVCRSLFERHKLLFSFLLCTKIMFGDNKIDMQEWRFFLAGPSGEIEQKPNPTNWLDDLEWGQVYEQLWGMSQMETFKGLDAYFIEFQKKFKTIYDSVTPHQSALPGNWDEKLNMFQKMIILKALRPDKICLAIQDFIAFQLGKEFIDPPTFNLGACYKDSTNITPLVFVLSPGTDPVADFKKYAAEAGMENKIGLVSLGQGQEKKAEKEIEKAKLTGGWALLQNCHLMEFWMPTLEAIVEQLTDQNHEDFRIWLTSTPTPAFPVSVLQGSVKMTLEPPSGLRSNLMRTYANYDNKMLNDCAKPDEYKKLIFAFAFFHACVQDRRKFGPIGWNIMYKFTNEDLMVCTKQLKNFLDEYDEIPYKVLQFLGAEVNYGGRVTDDKDIRLISSIIKRFINPQLLEENFKFSDSGTYRTIAVGGVDDYLKYISDLPLVPDPEAFGLHDNAEITTNQAATRELLELVLSVQPRTSSGGGKSREEVIAEITKGIQDKTPQRLDYDDVIEKYPTSYNESMNTVLAQEVIRYNTLLDRMVIMLADVQKALLGEVVMSEELDDVANSLFNNQVPKAFGAVGPLSLKPLGSWITDINDRMNFITKWYNEGMPPAFWLSGLFFPQAFFTGAAQNYARKYELAIDELSFDFKVYDEVEPSELQAAPEDGVFCYGLFLEGARWNNTTHKLDESKPKQLYVELPLIWFKPERKPPQPSNGVYGDPNAGVYMCPVYKVLSRTGTLSTTGHSTNFVMYIDLPSDEDENHWIRRGVAAFLALRY